MCKFHKDVAIQIATGADNIFDPVRYSIIMCALSRYWIDLYMPEVDYLDGYSVYEMATPRAVAALRKSETINTISQDVEGVISHAAANAPQLRKALDQVILEQELTSKTLNLPKRPLNNLKALSEISADIYEGDPAEGLNVKAAVNNPAHEPMRRAVSSLFDKDGFEPVLRTMIAGSFARLMTEAQSRVNPVLLKAYDNLPYGLRTSFASCALHGGGGSIGTHALCLMMPAAVGAVGMVASPIIAIGIDRALEWHQGNSFSWKRSASVASFSLAIAFGINALWPHDHLNTVQAKEFNHKQKDDQDVILVSFRREYEALPDALRQRVNEQAAKKNISPEMYLAICDGSDSLGKEITAFQDSQKNDQSSWATKIKRAFEF